MSSHTTHASPAGSHSRSEHQTIPKPIPRSIALNLRFACQPRPWARALVWAQPSVGMNWPWSDLLSDVVLTSVGGLGAKGCGEGGVLWVGEPLWQTVVASCRSKSSKIEDILFSKPLWRIVVASGWSKSSNIEGLGFVKPLWRAVVASGGSKLTVVQGQRGLYQTENS